MIKDKLRVERGKGRKKKPNYKGPSESPFDSFPNEISSVIREVVSRMS
jgi:hypothetical protein